MSIRPMVISDHPAVHKLFQETPGISVRDADSLESTERYLARNPGLSFVAESEDQIVGCLMSGHDGRRGYLQHLVVREAYRRQGLAKQLVDRCILALAEVGIAKSHVDVMVSNHQAQKFWSALGWQLRDDILRYSHISSGSADA